MLLNELIENIKNGNYGVTDDYTVAVRKMITDEPVPEYKLTDYSILVTSGSIGYVEKFVYGGHYGLFGILALSKCEYFKKLTIYLTCVYTEHPKMIQTLIFRSDDGDANF